MTRTRRSARNVSRTRADAVRVRRDRRSRRALRATPAVAKARTPRELEAARERRQSRRPKRTRSERSERREWRAAMGAAGLAVGLGSAALPHVSLPRIGWRVVSFSMAALLGTLLVHTMTAPEFFIDSINLAGARYIPGDEVYRAASVHAENIFWIDPFDVEANIEKIPAVMDATVLVQWPPDVQVEIVERAPVLTWSQGGETVWVDPDGAAFAIRGEVPDLLPILVDDAAQPWPLDANVPAPVIEGALELKALRPNIELLHYDSRFGLSYQDGRGWRGYFGVGPGMESKLIVYETLIDDLMARRIYPAMIDVGKPDSPYYRK